MVLHKCPKCHEMVNFESVSCPRCGVIFREYRIKRIVFWLLVVMVAAWVFHRQLTRYVDRYVRHRVTPTLNVQPAPRGDHARSIAT